jgi:hypothetical protein
MFFLFKLRRGNLPYSTTGKQLGVSKAVDSFWITTRGLSEETNLPASAFNDQRGVQAGRRQRNAAGLRGFDIRRRERHGRIPAWH